MPMTPPSITQQRNIILTGFMGTGKTTVGKQLARRLGWDFVDTDARIEHLQGCSVAEIFEHQGEEAFRRYEAQVAAALAAGYHCVIATGGRLMLDHRNAIALARESRVFCLQAPAEEILLRIRSSPHRRPLLDGPDPDRRVRQLLAQRQEGYSRFEAVTTENLTPRQVVEELLRRLSETPPSIQGAP